MREQTQRLEQQERISDLADTYLNKALANGESFSEALCNWAVNKAEQELGSPSFDSGQEGNSLLCGDYNNA